MFRLRIALGLNSIISVWVFTPFRAVWSRQSPPPPLSNYFLGKCYTRFSSPFPPQTHILLARRFNHPRRQQLLTPRGKCNEHSPWWGCGKNSTDCFCYTHDLIPTQIIYLMGSVTTFSSQCHLKETLFCDNTMRRVHACLLVSFMKLNYFARRAKH